MRIQIIPVPGPVIEVSVPAGATVVDVAQEATKVKPDINFVRLVHEREVRVNKRKFSNVADVDEAAGYAGSILSTPLDEGDVIAIVIKIQGNYGSNGLLTCIINGQEYALETPDTIANVLKNVLHIDPATVASVTVDGDEANLEDWVGDEDDIEVEFEGEDEDDDDPVITVCGENFKPDDAGKLAAIQAILEL